MFVRFRSSRARLQVSIVAKVNRVNRRILALGLAGLLLNGCAVYDFMMVNVPPMHEVWVYTGHPQTDWGVLSDAHYSRVNSEPPDSDHCMQAAGYVKAMR
jgi:hypothetical protein